MAVTRLKRKKQKLRNRSQKRRSNLQKARLATYTKPSAEEVEAEHAKAPEILANFRAKIAAQNNEEKAESTVITNITRVSGRKTKTTQVVKEAQAVEETKEEIVAETPAVEEAKEEVVPETPAVEEAKEEIVAEAPAVEEETKEEVVAETPAVEEETKEEIVAEASEKDDLKKINKIGPAFERRLNALGIFTYADLVNLNDEKIEKLEEKDSMTSLEQWHKWMEEAKGFMA